MPNPEDPDVVPRRRHLKADVEPSSRVRVLFQQLIRGGAVQAPCGPDPEFATQGRVHEASIDVGELVDLLLFGRVHERYAVFVGGGIGTGDEVLDVVLAAGCVDLLGDIRGDRNRVDVLGERQCPQIGAGRGGELNIRARSSAALRIAAVVSHALRAWAGDRGWSRTTPLPCVPRS